jgi:HSP20 family protein
MALPIRRRSPAPPDPRPARWEPFRELEELREPDGQDLARRPPGGERSTWSPLAEIEETDNTWILEAEVPGRAARRRQDRAARRELRISGELDEDTQRGGTPRQRMRRIVASSPAPHCPPRWTPTESRRRSTTAF